jgi:hypothetical protein
MTVTVPRPDQINWDNLTADSRWALKHVAGPLLNGADMAEIASETGLPRKDIAAALDRLKSELRQQTTTTVGAPLSFTRPLALVLDATDLELARWTEAARRTNCSLEQWLRNLANKAAA